MAAVVAAEELADSAGMGSISKGHIQLVTGPMFAGKSQELVRRVRRYQIARMTCIVIKPAADTRDDATRVTTHTSDGIPAMSAIELMPHINPDGKIDPAIEDADVVAIDEGQFFGDLVEACVFLADNNKTVIVAALDGTYKMKPFAPVSNLIPHVQSMVKLSAVCVNCTAPAAHSKLLVEEHGDDILIGGTETYAAACRACHKLPVDKFRTSLVQQTQI